MSEIGSKDQFWVFLFQMDYMSQLLAIGEGGLHFFVSCLLHLPPEDLKACRLVNKTWDKVVKERVGGNKRVRKRLDEKLLNRWKTTNPETIHLGMVPCRVLTIFCNHTQVFCGTDSCSGGVVKVYSLADGQLVKDLDISRAVGQKGAGTFHSASQSKEGSVGFGTSQHPIFMKLLPDHLWH